MTFEIEVTTHKVGTFVLKPLFKHVALLKWRTNRWMQHIQHSLLRNQPYAFDWSDKGVVSAMQEDGGLRNRAIDR